MPSVLHRAKRLLCAGLLLLLAAQGAAAHEYWIAPTPPIAAPGERVAIRLLVGQEMQATEVPWLSYQMRSFRVAGPESVIEVKGLEGDLPAFAFTPEAPGLYVIAHETQPLTLTFDDMAEFRDYLEYEGLGEVADAHLARGLPETGFTEAYQRSAKALLAVGKGGGADRRMGLDYELVALNDPFAGSASLAVELLLRGAPAANVPLAVFRQAGDTVERILTGTDAEGRAEIALEPGSLYLLNAVHIDPVEGRDHVWLSTWASLFFATPG